MWNQLFTQHISLTKDELVLMQNLEVRTPALGLIPCPTHTYGFLLDMNYNKSITPKTP